MLPQNLNKISTLIQETDLVLDVGGWHAPLNRANTVLDIMPYKTRQRNNALLKEKWPEEHFNEKSFHQMDICKAPWPFADKAFDFSICSHTLEDLRDPIAVCRELVRVSKAGYIEVPSRLVESTRGIERPFYCGYYHHRWLCEWDGNILRFMFKPAMLHAYRKFYFRKPWGKKMNQRYDTIGFFWSGEFLFEEKIVIDRDEVQNDLVAFKKKYRGLKDLFVPKHRQCMTMELATSSTEYL